MLQWYKRGTTYRKNISNRKDVARNDYCNKCYIICDKCVVDTYEKTLILQTTLNDFFNDINERIKKQ